MKHLLGVSTKADNAFSPVLHIGMDKHMDAVLTISQGVVSTAADDHTGTFLCQTPDHIGLIDELLISHRLDSHGGYGIGKHGDIKKEVACLGCIFADFFNKIGVGAA